ARASIARTRIAVAGSSWFATTMPSIMSATTSAKGRARIRTATTGPPGRRRIVRTAETVRGGVRNTGATRPAARAATASRRAVSANLAVGTSATVVLNNAGETATAAGRRSRPGPRDPAAGAAGVRGARGRAA